MLSRVRVGLCIPCVGHCLVHNASSGLVVPEFSTLRVLEDRLDLYSNLLHHRVPVLVLGNEHHIQENAIRQLGPLAVHLLLEEGEAKVQVGLIPSLFRWNGAHLGRILLQASERRVDTLFVMSLVLRPTRLA